MIGWHAGTGRPDVKLPHSRISAYMASPCRGALKAVLQVVRYCAHNKHWCLFQPFDEEGAWTHFSDSDHAGNPEPAAKRKSQLGYVSMCGRVPIGWGSKGTSVADRSPRLTCPVAELQDPGAGAWEVSPSPRKDQRENSPRFWNHPEATGRPN